MKRRIIAYLVLVLGLVFVGSAWSDYCTPPDTVSVLPQNGETCGYGNGCLVKQNRPTSVWINSCFGTNSACTNYRACSWFFIEWFRSDLCGECNNTTQNNLLMMWWTCEDPSGEMTCSSMPENLTTYAITVYPTTLDCHYMQCSTMTVPPAPYTLTIPGNGVPPGCSGAITPVGGRAFNWAQPVTYVPPSVTY